MKVKPPKERFFKCTRERWTSPLWLATNAYERNVYLVLTGPPFTGWNNGKIHASLDFIVKYTGLGRTSIVRALRGLAEKGLIKRTFKGGVFRGKPSPSTFEICEFPSAWNGRSFDVEPRLDWTTATLPITLKSKRKGKSPTVLKEPYTVVTLRGASSCTDEKLKTCTEVELMGYLPEQDPFINLDVYGEDITLSADSREDEAESWRTEASEPEEELC